MPAKKRPEGPLMWYLNHQIVADAAYVHGVDADEYWVRHPAIPGTIHYKRVVEGWSVKLEVCIVDTRPKTGAEPDAGIGPTFARVHSRAVGNDESGEAVREFWGVLTDAAFRMRGDRSERFVREITGAVLGARLGPANDK